MVILLPDDNLTKYFTSKYTNKCLNNTGKESTLMECYHSLSSPLTKPMYDLLKWHERIGHLNFYSIQTLSKRCFLPSNIKQCLIPTCASCQYGKAHKRDRLQGISGNLSQNKILKPGICSSSIVGD